MALWQKFLKTGVLHQPAPETAPDAFFCEEAVRDKLLEAVKIYIIALLRLEEIDF